MAKGVSKPKRFRSVRWKQQGQKVRKAARAMGPSKHKMYTQGTNVAAQRQQIVTDSKRAAALRKAVKKAQKK